MSRSQICEQKVFGCHVTEIDRKFQGGKSHITTSLKSLKICKHVQFSKKNILVRNLGAGRVSYYKNRFLNLIKGTTKKPIPPLESAANV